jgi:hypothetical protein
MYTCFKKIPRRFRQAAFDAIVKNGKFPHGVYGGTYCRTRIAGDDGNVICCPLGMVNKVIIDKFASKKDDEFLGKDNTFADWFDTTYSLPTASNETYLLDKTLSANVNEVDVERFIDRVDNKLFPTLASLASAMGVTYKVTRED